LSVGDSLVGKGLADEAFHIIGSCDLPVGV